MGDLNFNKTTIAAIATPPGEGGVAVVRISGKEAIPIASTLFSGPVAAYLSHTAHLGAVLDEGVPIDEALLLVMRAPKSYTGEDVVEIHCHGGSLISRKVLELALRSGAKMADAGEFTYRAFLNGKLDLTQAEAVQTLIGAKNDLALEAAKDQLAGKLSEYIRQIQYRLLDLSAIFEAAVDFPEEGLEFGQRETISQSIRDILLQIRSLVATFHEGKKIQEGITLCLIGTPNAGKSSLMNALLMEERAIVTPIEGTTRDVIEAPLILGQLHFHLLDTAGIRVTEEEIEREGIRRSEKALANSDIILLLIDSSKPFGEEEKRLLNRCNKEKTLLIWNKVDLPHSISEVPFPFQVALSVKTGEGIERLKEAIEEMVWKGKSPSKGEVILTHLRHKEAIDAAGNDLEVVLKGLETNLSFEFLASDTRNCLNHLNRVIGIDISEEILSAIFSKFCVGK